MNRLQSEFEAAVLAGGECLSDWHVITQDMVNEYAALTGDGEGEWVHLDPSRAAQEPPYYGTIVQGFLQVSHLVRLHAQAVKDRPLIDRNHALNYGFDRLRFVGQMPVGAKFRARVRANEIVTKSGGGRVLKQEVRLELEDGRPTLVADWLFYLDPRAFGES
ncbi:MaoC/PaaZ C-terminal domain-containing protein [Pseudomonas sp.]|jgi:acyl dehydratase|uniref:MaoC/PaaZ C-terminal domain-containing protein n=1 Tax=Pseudomonas sp. TaxID=306 RepID=UPI00272BFC5A|nr:MaoC/PaaZ C-terminal domain-containing protein [Pseudomonas sp.]